MSVLRKVFARYPEALPRMAQMCVFGAVLADYFGAKLPGKEWMLALRT